MQEWRQVGEIFHAGHREIRLQCCKPSAARTVKPVHSLLQIYKSQLSIPESSQHCQNCFGCSVLRCTASANWHWLVSENVITPLVTVHMPPPAFIPAYQSIGKAQWNWMWNHFFCYHHSSNPFFLLFLSVTIAAIWMLPVCVCVCMKTTTAWQ